MSAGEKAARAVLERTANEGRNYMRDATDDEAAVLEDFAIYLLGVLDHQVCQKFPDVPFAQACSCQIGGVA